MGIAMRHFIADETGAVTVDWVVLTAAIVGLGLLVLIPIAVGTQSIGNKAGEQIGAISLGFQ